MMKKGKIITGIVAGALLLGSMGTMLNYAFKGGKSAYDIAVENGFVGTQEQWLASLQGSKGTDGRDGTNGRDGLNGRDGQNGLNGIDGLNGRDGRDGTDGVQGPTGEMGPQGETGLTPYIDEVTGNWFIGEVDTGVHAQGPKGDSPKVERRVSSFDEVYTEITKDNKFDLSLIDVVELDDKLSISKFKNMEDANEYYQSLDGVHIAFNYKIEGNKHIQNDNLEEGDVDATFVGEGKFVKIEHDGINDISCLIEYAMSRVDTEGVIVDTVKMEFNYIDGKYYQINEFSETINGEPYLNELVELLNGYYEIKNRDDYINTIASIGYICSYAATSNIITELIANQDYKQHSLEQRIGDLDLYIFNILLPFSKCYYEDNTYTFNWKYVPALDTSVKIDVGLTKTDNKQETSFKYNEVYNHDENTVSFLLSRNGLIEKDPSLTFEATSEITESMSEMLPDYEEEDKIMYANLYGMVPLISDFSEETMSFFE